MPRAGSGMSRSSVSPRSQSATASAIRSSTLWHRRIPKRWNDYDDLSEVNSRSRLYCTEKRRPGLLGHLGGASERSINRTALGGADQRNRAASNSRLAGYAMRARIRKFLRHHPPGAAPTQGVQTHG